MIKIALLGKPNVGKSSLFNRFSRKLDAITSHVSGTTRDIKKSEILMNGKPILLMDTGGLDDSTTLFQSVQAKSFQAADMADIILYMVDGKTLPSDEDKAIFFSLQKLGKPLALVVNKMDSDKQSDEIGWEFHSFGAKNLFFLSVSHNRGTKLLTDWIDTFLPALPVEENIEGEDGLSEDDINTIEETIEEEEESNEIKIAIIGRVNVGKSSLLNALTGEERSVVSDVAGTTVDPVDETFEYKGKQFTFVDTAGIRKRGKIEGIERHALQRTQRMLETADLALIVLDASEPFKELDEKIAHLVDKFALGCIIVLNKWDITEESYEKNVELVRDRFVFLSYAPIITLSALSHKRVHKINDMILRVYENYSRRISTSKLNEVIKYAGIKHHLPADMGKLVKIYFATQYESKPPRIALVMNRPKALHFSYNRYLVNQLREAFDFEGVPLVIEAKAKKVDEERAAKYL
ncbi:MAG TPA: ribosome biogenesis GTPase Der [Campylobacterales bacterium]|nr:ribosome biogenesis GTPase Der [Campylobacterales bacterium]